MMRWLLSMLCVAAIAGSATASTHPARVVLLPIENDVTGVGNAVAEALETSDLDMVSAAQLERAIERLGLTVPLAERDVARLAARLEADAVIEATYDRRLRKLRFTIVANDKKGKPFSVRADSTRSAKFRKLVRRTLVAKLAAVAPVHVDLDSATEEAAPDKPGNKAAKRGAPELAPELPRIKHAAPDEAEAAAEPANKPAKPARDARAASVEDGSARKPATRPGDDAAASKPDEDPAARKPAAKLTADAATRKAARRSSDAGEEPAGEAPPDRTPRLAGDDGAVGIRGRAGPASTPGANLAAVRADLGVSLSARELRFKSRVFDGAPGTYTNTAVPGARFEAELYPFACLDRHGLLAGLGVAGDFDQTIALTLRASSEMTVPLKATARHYSVGVRYRIALGHAPTSPTVTLGVGYAVRSFVVDRAGLMAGSLDLPDVGYRMFDPGLAIRVPIGRRIAVTLAGRALLLTAAGRIQDLDQYGQSKIYGGSASAGIELVLGNRVVVRVAGEATQLSLTFAGGGALTTSRDGDASTVDVSGATDRYLGGAATLAVVY